MAEYLSIIDIVPGVPQGCNAFKTISPNLLEESAVSDEVGSPDQEGICTLQWFKVDGLVELLHKAASLFSEAKMYETTNEVRCFSSTHQPPNPPTPSLSLARFTPARQSPTLLGRE